MLKECRQALRITTDAYDGELCSLMQAAVRDLEIAGVVIPGIVSFTSTVTTGGGDVYTDLSSVDDPLITRAIFTYVRLHFGTPPDYERLKESYNAQKVQLMHASDYTNYDGCDGGDGE